MQTRGPATSAPPAAAAASTTPLAKFEGKRIKTSNVIDPTDETELAAPGPGQIDIWYANYKALKHGEPLPEYDPSPEQVAALSARILQFGLEPYADFSVLTPYGRRFQKRLRHRSWLLQENGAYLPVDVPGPGSWDAWEPCWKVYETVLLMLRTGPEPDAYVATPSALEAYFVAFQSLCRSFPEAWHLCVAAEDRCRAEHFPRLARRLAAATGTAPTWSAVFIAAAEDDRYWSTEVRNPALGFLARGRRSGPPADPGSARDPPSRRQQDQPVTKKQRQRAGRDGSKTGWKREYAPPPPPHAGGKGGGKNKGEGAHPRKDKKGLFVTTREGQDICFTWAKGERDGCAEPCQRQRAHVCQHCLQPHRNAACGRRREGQ